MGKEPTAGPANLIMEGGTATRDDLIAGTERGVLVTRFWYIRPLDPQTILVTGLTRDGLFLIEKGKVTRPLKNMRWNESPIVAFNNIDAMTAAGARGERRRASAAPASRWSARRRASGSSRSRARRTRFKSGAGVPRCPSNGIQDFLAESSSRRGVGHVERLRELLDDPVERPGRFFLPAGRT